MKYSPPRVLHAAFISSPSLGVVRQMEWEVDAAKSLGLEWDCRLYAGVKIESNVVHALTVERNLGKLKKYFTVRDAYFRELEAVVESYDLILLRHMVHSFRELRFIQKYGDKVLTVHHTREAKELLELLPFPFNIISAGIEHLIGSYSIYKARALVAVTSELKDYEIARSKSHTGPLGSFVYPNGIVFSRRGIVDRRGEVPEFVFVASNFFSWHGLDRLLDSMALDPSACVVHIVGLVSGRLLARCEREPRIRLHGICNHSYLWKLYEQSWCGISSLALDRKGMRQACTLKTREYLEVGLPVYADHEDSALPASFDFFQQGGADLKKIISFSKKYRNVDRYLIQKEAEKYISKAVLLERLYGSIRKLD